MDETVGEFRDMTTSEKSNQKLTERGERVAVFVDVEVSECQRTLLFLFDLFESLFVYSI